jgi:drug/metabolite transporter (DMT)-like permease
MSKWAGHLSLIASTLIMGSAYVAAKLALDDSGPFVTAFFRFLIASLVCWPVLYLVGGVQPVRRHHIGYLLGYGLFQTTLYFALQYLGLRYTTASNTALIVNTRPLFMALLALFFFKERFNLVQWIAFLLSFSGVLIILYNPGVAIMPNHTFGDFLIVLDALCGALGVLLGKKLLYDFKPFTILVYQITIGTIGLLPLALIETNGHLFTARVNWGIVLFLAIFLTAIAQSLFNFGLSKLPVSNTAVYFFFIPVINVILAYYMFSEPITVSLVIGGILIIGGTYFVNKKTAVTIPK